MNNSTHFKVGFSTNTSPMTRISRDLAIFVFAFLGVNILVATFGNARVLFMLRRRRDLRKVPHYFLANLAMTGFLSALVKMPYLTLMTTVNYFELSANLPATMEVFCKLAFPLTFAFTVLNALTFPLMALDRQDRVLRPFSLRITPSKVKKIIPLTWGLSLLTAVVIAILIRNYEQQSACVKYYPYSKVTTSQDTKALHIVTIFTGLVENIAVLIIAVSYIRIRKKLRSSATNSSSSGNQRQEKQVTKFTFSICAMFLLFKLPVVLCHSVTKIGEFRGATTNSVTLVTVTLTASMHVAIPFLHHKMLQVRPPNQQTRDQPRVTAWRSERQETGDRRRRINLICANYPS